MKFYQKVSKIMILGLCLSLVLFCGSLGYAANSDDWDGECGPELKWKFDAASGTLTIGGSGVMKDFSNYSVPWNENRDSIKKVILPKGITNIGENAFFRCDNLTSIDLPQGLTTVGEYAFYDCDLLQTVSFPESLTRIERRAFAYCENLTTITLPASLDILEEGAFYGCKNLTSVYFKGDVPSTIEYYVFTGAEDYCKIYYKEGKSGWTDRFEDSKWNDHPLEVWTAGNSPSEPTVDYSTPEPDLSYSKPEANLDDGKSGNNYDSNKTSAKAAFVIGAASYTLNGKKYSMDAAAYISNGRTMLPIRYVARALGINDSNIVWDNRLRTVTLSKGSVVLQVPADSDYMTVNGVRVIIDAANPGTMARIIEGRLYLPVRGVCEQFGYSVGWEAKEQKITISSVY